MNVRFALPVLVITAALAAGGCAGTRAGGHLHHESPGASAGAGFYYDDLAPYGMWVDAPPYGPAWCPADVPYGWRPYTVGYWAYTDYGWLWISEDPWGWVPYHYGRWTFDPYYGWLWIPGDVWAPAWVAWRYGPGWIGWAPLPPEVQWRTGVGLYYSAYELDEHIDRYYWSFTEAKDFGTTRVRVNVEPPSKNVTLLRKTRDVTKYGVIGTTPVERGLTPVLIQRDVGKEILPYRVKDAPGSQRERGVVVGDREVQVYRPEGRITTVVRERVRDVPPEQKPVPPEDLRDRAEQERKQFAEQVKRDRERLEKEQQSELQERPPGTSAQELRRRHEAELRAQQEVEEREKKAMEERAQKLRERLDRERERREKPREPEQPERKKEKDGKKEGPRDPRERTDR
jgi:hypothetical protein